jgi:hypothetical protein
MVVHLLVQGGEVGADSGPEHEGGDRRWKIGVRSSEFGVRSSEFGVRSSEMRERTNTECLMRQTQRSEIG